MRSYFSSSRSLVTLLCGVVATTSVGVMIAPRQAHATILGDAAIASLVTKEFTLDTAAWLIKRAAVEALVQSSLNWINSGFQGSPAFVTNLRENLLLVGDTAAEHFFNELADTVIDSPYQDEIALAVRTSYYLSTGGTFYIQNPFTLDQYSDDPEAFLSGDFSRGGLSAWFSTVTNCQNNPYCAYQLAVGELNSRIAGRVGQESRLLDWGQGFKSFRGNCRAPASGGTDAERARLEAAQDSGSSVALAKSEPCLEAGIRTPGALIAPRANEALGAGERELVTADEINEVVGALFAQLVNQAFGNNGLVSVSYPTAGGGRPYIDQAVGQGGSTAGNGVPQADIISYLTNWQKIATVAEAAIAYCPNSTVVQNARTNAQNATIRGTQALAAADSGTQTGAAITPQEVQQSRSDTREDTTNSLYGQLQEIVNTKQCPS